MDLDQLKILVETRFNFLSNVGLKVLLIEPGRVRLWLPRQGNENHLGTVWAGALFTLAEVPGGILAMTLFDSTVFFPVVKEMTIRYLKPAATDVTVEIAMDPETAETVAREARETGRADFTLTAELKDSKERVVAVTQGLYQLRKY